MSTKKSSAPATNPGLKKEARIQKITPYLWFDGQAEEAAKFSRPSLRMRE
jgi:hypothetical protein